MLDKFDRFLNFFITQDRQNGSENLLLHHAELRIWTQDQGRRNLSCGGFEGFPIRVDADDFRSVLPGFLDHPVQTCKMIRRNDRSVIRIVVQTGISFFDEGLEQFDEIMKLCPFHKNIVRSNTDLSGVCQFSENNPFRSPFQVRTGADQGGGLTSEFQGQRRQVFRCRV